MTFQQKYLKILNIVQEEIEQVVVQMIEVIDVQEPLKSKLFNFLNAPAKHIRPLLSFLYLKACDIEITNEQIILQSAIELVHNASLIHDDIIDNSDLRRTLITINKDFDNTLAVLSGDFILSKALQMLCSLNSVKLIEMFALTLDEMCKGEVSQYFKKNNIPTMDEYIQKSIQKTAKLFETSLNGALLIANQNFNSDFALNFGLAFQIRDDLINAKTSKTDIQDGIYTAPIILSKNLEDLQNGIEKTKILLNNYLEKAINSLENIPDNEYKKSLINLIGLLQHE